MLIEIIFLQEFSKDLSSNPHQLPAKVILIQMTGFSKKKRKKKKKKRMIFSIKGLGTRGIRLVLLRLLKKKKTSIKIFNSLKKFKISKFFKKKKNHQSKFSIPSKNLGFPKLFKKTKKFKSPKKNLH